jgi:hypothetical protein
MDELTCPNCGAALPASAANADVVTCQYCNVTFRVPRTSTPEPDMGNLILGADFSHEPIPGWGFPNKDNIKLLNGTPPELRFKLTPKSGVYYALNSSGFFDDIDASVSVQFYEGNLDYIDAGIMLRYRKGVGSYNVFISPLGTYALAYYEKGTDDLEWKSILSWTKHTALKPGLNQINRIRFISSKDHLHVYFNGVMATSVHDTHYQEGMVQLAAEATDKSSIDVGFTDLQLREVKG